VWAELSEIEDNVSDEGVVVMCIGVACAALLLRILFGVAFMLRKSRTHLCV
jgi:hypothetical protein